MIFLNSYSTAIIHVNWEMKATVKCIVPCIFCTDKHQFQEVPEWQNMLPQRQKSLDLDHVSDKESDATDLVNDQNQDQELESLDLTAVNDPHNQHESKEVYSN